MLLEIAFWVSVVIAVGLTVMAGFVIGVNDERKKKDKHYHDLTTRAMADAYNAGFIDGKNDGKPRPTKKAK